MKATVQAYTEEGGPMANLLSLEGCVGGVGADEYSGETAQHCEDRKGSKMG